MVGADVTMELCFIAKISSGIGRQLLPADDLLHQLEEYPGHVLRQEASQHAPERRGCLQQVQQHVSNIVKFFDKRMITEVAEVAFLT